VPEAVPPPIDETRHYLPPPVSLLTTWHHPATAPSQAVVVVPPFGEELKAAQRALVELARALAAAGVLAIRYDARGTGDSPLDHGEVDLTIWREDLAAVLAALRARFPNLPVTLLGLRFGATLAWLAAAENLGTLPMFSTPGARPENVGSVPGFSGLVLLEPLPSGASYMRQNRQRSQIRRELTDGEGPATVEGGEGEFAAFDFDGFAISSALHEQMASVELGEVRPLAQSALILQLSGSSRIKKPLEALRESAEAAGLATTLDTVAVEAFWSAVGLVDTAEVREKVLGWLELPTVAVGGPSARVSDQYAAIGEQVTAEPFVMPSGDQTVVGTVYQPADGPVDRAVILLHGWSGYRIGPGRLLTKAARSLAEAGYLAVSFDFRGRGESSWEVGQASLNTMIKDAGRVVPYVCDRYDVSKVTLLGLCSGGEVAIGASLGDPRIDSLVLWSAPIFSGAFDFARRARRSKAMVAGYVRKLFLKETWAKLLGGRLNWKMIARAVSGGRSAEDAGVEDKAPDTASQMKEFEAFQGRLLFVYGGNDPETEPSRTFYQSFVERTGRPAKFVEIEGANHNFYSCRWHQEIIGWTIDWLAEDGDEP